MSRAFVTRSRGPEKSRLSVQIMKHEVGDNEQTLIAAFTQPLQG
jgi:hypothetical protein